MERSNTNMCRQGKSNARNDQKMLHSIRYQTTKNTLYNICAPPARICGSSLVTISKKRHRPFGRSATPRHTFNTFTQKNNLRESFKILGLTTLTERRQRGDMIQLFKIFNNIDKLETKDKIELQNNQKRVHRFKYYKEITKQAQRENFFFNRSANLWNSLPIEVVNAESVNSFKAGLDCWMSSIRANQLS